MAQASGQDASWFPSKRCFDHNKTGREQLRRTLASGERKVWPSSLTNPPETQTLISQVTFVANTGNMKDMCSEGAVSARGPDHSFHLFSPSTRTHSTPEMWPWPALTCTAPRPENSWGSSSAYSLFRRLIPPDDHHHQCAHVHAWGQERGLLMQRAWNGQR